MTVVDELDAKMVAKEIGGLVGIKFRAQTIHVDNAHAR
jgi:hypothetical protein